MNSSARDTDVPKFMSIDVATLRTNTIPDFSIYLFNEPEERYVLYRNGTTRFNESDRQRLLENHVSELYVTDADRSKLQTYLEDNLERIVSDERLSTEEKAKLVYQSASGRVQQVLENPTAGDNIKRSKRVVENIVNFVLADKTAISKLISMTIFDYEVYTHSVNVCTYGLALARHLGFTDLRELSDLGTGMLLHDVGKSNVPKDILKKPEPLQPDDWELMKQHPRTGYEILSASRDINRRSLEIALYHHEHADSSGYPYGLSLEEIPPWAKICRLADVFDALTTRRSYKDALRPFQALHVMAGEMNQTFDPQLLTQFITLLGPGKVSTVNKTPQTTAS